MTCGGYGTSGAIDDDTRHPLHEWFPGLPSYGGFVQRLNPLADGFVPLLEALQAECPQTEVRHPVRLLDSMPIRLAHAKRSRRACVAAELANKGYCASKGEYDYGVKVPILGSHRPVIRTSWRFAKWLTRCAGR